MAPVLRRPLEWNTRPARISSSGTFPSSGCAKLSSRESNFTGSMSPRARAARVMSILQGNHLNNMADPLFQYTAAAPTGISGNWMIVEAGTDAHRTLSNDHGKDRERDGADSRWRETIP
jgi:hypothetical protein